ncbi:hypothetical protein C2G38_2240145 [Gigaspora rosea]|uniref:HAT C-terminal dimerisation domain-containing protein n=1 Tax=Gigaspora rosea TaxID=44941 RepID=A0A397W544_9GLOM|nr:hypothetical protein C2G38_2240145 [Gigaspora rosea]
MFSIVPHQAACERVFSILNWMIEKKKTRLNINLLQSMTQIHSFYITNIASKLKFSKEKFNENELEKTINEIAEALIENNDLFNEDNNDNENEDEDKDEDSFDIDDEKDESNLNDLLISEMIDLNSYNINETENILP